jgi:hypothetical protein
VRLINRFLRGNADLSYDVETRERDSHTVRNLSVRFHLNSKRPVRSSITASIHWLSKNIRALLEAE